jgi:hypothetical protein
LCVGTLDTNADTLCGDLPPKAISYNGTMLGHANTWLDGMDIKPTMARPNAMAPNLIIQVLLYVEWLM